MHRSKCQLCLPLESTFVSLGSKASRVKETNRFKSTRDGVDSEGLHANRLDTNFTSFSLTIFGNEQLTGAAGLAAAFLGANALKAEAEEAKRAMAAVNFMMLVGVLAERLSSAGVRNCET